MARLFTLFLAPSRIDFGKNLPKTEKTMALCDMSKKEKKDEQF